MKLWGKVRNVYLYAVVPCQHEIGIYFRNRLKPNATYKTLCLKSEYYL
jgi:hypothetical protein